MCEVKRELHGGGETCVLTACTRSSKFFCARLAAAVLCAIIRTVKQTRAVSIIKLGYDGYQGYWRLFGLLRLSWVFWLLGLLEVIRVIKVIMGIMVIMVIRSYSRY